MLRIGKSKIVLKTASFTCLKISCTLLLLFRKRRRSNPLVEEDNPADNPAVDNDGVIVEPIRPDVSTPVNANPEQTDEQETTVAETRSNSDTTPSQNAGEATSTTQPLVDTSAPGPEASPDVITPTTSDNVRSDASQFSAHTDIELGGHHNAGFGQSVGDAGSDSAPSTQPTSQANTALDATLPVIDEIEVWQGSTRTG